MVYGNLAYKYDIDDDEAVRVKSQTNAKQNIVKRKVQKSKKLSYTEKMISVVIVTISAIFMIIQFIEVNDSIAELAAAREKYNFEQSVTAQKSFELEQSIDLSKIEQEATMRLGMRRPEKYQTVYIDVPQDDTTDKTADEVEGMLNRCAGAMKSIMDNIVGFFSI